MARIVRWHEILEEPLSNQLLEERQKDGWKLAGVEWERLVEDAGLGEARQTEEVPYGLRVAGDCQHLEENPVEREVLELMLGLIAADRALSKVAEALNRGGYRTRSGVLWTQTAVFDLLPRLIEAAPRLRRIPALPRM
jgi:hypothetical protein